MTVDWVPPHFSHDSEGMVISFTGRSSKFSKSTGRAMSTKLEYVVHQLDGICRIIPKAENLKSNVEESRNGTRNRGATDPYYDHHHARVDRYLPANCFLKTQCFELGLRNEGHPSSSLSRSAALTCEGPTH
jgi:hypothetical protein